MRTAALLLCLLFQEERKAFDPAVHEATKTFAYADFLVIPVRVHLLRCAADDALQCQLKDDDIRRIFSKVNRIWNRAGLALHPEIVSEDAVRPEGFEENRLEQFRAVRPGEKQDPGMIHVYYVHRLPTNGVYMGRDAIFVKDLAALREVKGGVDEPLPRVTSHEIGHAMGLPHRQDTINLMASGTTGWSINDDEITTVRGWAAKQDWILKPAAALDKGLHAILAQIPGESQIKDKAKAALERK